MSILNEIVLLIVVFFSTNMSYISSESNDFQKFEDTLHFINLFFGINMIMCVVQLTFLISKIVMFVWNTCCCCCHKKKKNKKNKKKKKNAVAPLRGVQRLEETKEIMDETERVLIRNVDV
jgi:uncharacterized membrane protein